MRKERIISLVLVLVMLCSMTVYGDETTNWFDKAIENAVSNGLYNSATAKSLANEYLTRAEMATVINRAFGSTLKASLDDFTDVPNKAWYYNDMAKAVSMGTFIGSEGKLNPENKITREETFTVLARSINLTSTDLAVLKKFSDLSDISSWAKQEIAAMVTAGYINGSDSKLNPKGNVTRAEFAQIMDNMIKGYFKVEGTYTSVPKGNILINTPNVNLKGVTITGDLIIGDGVGNGDVTLDSVKVTGRIIIRSKDVNSIKIIGDSSLNTIIFIRVNGNFVKAVKTETQTPVTTGSSSGGSSSGGESSVTISGVNISTYVNSNKINVTANVTNAGTGDTATIVLKSKESVIDDIKTKEIKAVPVVNGKINKTIYGLSNATYDVTVSVGNVSESAPNSVVVFSPILTVCSNDYYLLSELLGYYNKPQGIEFSVFDCNSSITGEITDYLYNVIATNQSTGVEVTLISNEQFDSDELLALHNSEGCSLTCYLFDFMMSGEALIKEKISMPEETLTPGEYAITIQIKSSGAGNLLVGESSFEILIDSTKPELSINYTNECITGYNISTMEYTLGNPYFGYARDVDWSVAGALKEFINQNYGAGISCRFQATASKQASESNCLNFPPRPSAPTGLNAIPTSQGNDGKITLLNFANYQYKLYTADSWSDTNITNTVSTQTYEIDNLAAGTYYVREKATDSNFASLATAITVLDSDSIALAAPELMSVNLNDESTKLFLKFDKTMSAKGLESAYFAVNGESYVNEYFSITSIGLKDDDNSTIELTISKAPSYYPITVSYASGTVVADDGGVLATFSRKSVDNMYLKITLKSGNNVVYGNFAIASVNGCNSANPIIGYTFADNGNTTAPATGTNIGAIDKVKKCVYYDYYIPGDIKPNMYFVLYSYDNKTGIINGFGQVKITEENIGKLFNRNNANFNSFTDFVVNGTTQYAISFGAIGEAQTVTTSGTNASDVEITTISGIQAYLVSTSDIAETGGTKKFTLTLSGDETNGQTNGDYEVKIIIYSPTPSIKIDNDSRRVNVSGTIPGAKIALYYYHDGFGSPYKDMEAIADDSGCAFFEGLEPNLYWVRETPTSGPGIGVDSTFSIGFTITE